MKKILYILTLVTTLFLFTNCGSHTCDAYKEHDVTQIEQTNPFSAGHHKIGVKLKWYNLEADSLIEKKRVRSYFMYMVEEEGMLSIYELNRYNKVKSKQHFLIFDSFSTPLSISLMVMDSEAKSFMITFLTREKQICYSFSDSYIILTGELEY